MEINKKYDQTMNVSYFDEHSLCHISYEDIKENKNCNRPLPNLSPNTLQSMSFINIENDSFNENRISSEPRDKSEDSDSNNGIELEHVKHKLSSLWNNVKYGTF